MQLTVVFTWVDSKGSLEGYQLWIFGLDSFEKKACSCRICPLELFIVFTFKYKKIPTGNCDGYTRMLQMNPPLLLNVYFYFILFYLPHNNYKKIKEKREKKEVARRPNLYFNNNLIIYPYLNITNWTLLSWFKDHKFSLFKI